MTNILFMIAYFAVMLGAVMLMFTLGRKYVFSKVKVNKWLLLGISVALFAVQFLFKTTNPWINILFTLVVVWFFIWFLDIQATGGPKKQEKKIEIKPKAKPNRVKHMQNQKNK
ncbi:hypothetical protein [Clostridium chauvoei]|uniref:Uncharacterized protein n=2 Tax=Clostridium chauvoei TaxID=46867 RepID=A0A1U6J767_9CLOT|nr:hypothetical protein [Clostridium chauvoei]ATD54756.1 hypothetical protein BTM20_05685 [Clostridium chauvoei]ATD57564.1 hypothetical protein BTM21_07375 [Clostridium chauvoei]MBX7281251.1 hypothetical protein [Clostridium chauvoei]MBX7283733.1 hypothetical protein [Clostridium chauvoei]MBX7286367.1 hypothetical protein [Clostridium chauvoei]